jgi:hypothetical protein
MKVYYHHCGEEKEIRAHPWITAKDNPEHKYYNFKENPDLIDKVLEDFAPYKEESAVRLFYKLLRWINVESVYFETNDCAFSPPKINVDNKINKNLQCSGRLMFLYRKLELNTYEKHTNSLKEALKFYLKRIDVDFEWGCIGITKLPVEYTSLRNSLGHEIMLTFWAWGDIDKEIFDNLERLFKNIFYVLKQIKLDIKESLKPT